MRLATRLCCGLALACLGGSIVHAAQGNGAAQPGGSSAPGGAQLVVQNPPPAVPPPPTPVPAGPAEAAPGAAQPGGAILQPVAEQPAAPGAGGNDTITM